MLLLLLLLRQERSLPAERVEGLRSALEAAGSSSRLEEYTHANPAYPNALEFAMCRRESAGVIEALCMAFPEMAAELLPGGQQQVRASLLIRPTARALRG